MTFDELVTRVLNLEEQNINLATRQSNRSADADSGISEAKAKTDGIDEELADSILSLVELINDVNEIIEEGGELNE